MHYQNKSRSTQQWKKLEIREINGFNLLGFGLIGFGCFLLHSWVKSLITIARRFFQGFFLMFGPLKESIFLTTFNVLYFQSSYQADMIPTELFWWKIFLGTLWGWVYLSFSYTIFLYKKDYLCWLLYLFNSIWELGFGLVLVSLLIGNT